MRCRKGSASATFTLDLHLHLHICQNQNICLPIRRWLSLVLLPTVIFCNIGMGHTYSVAESQCREETFVLLLFLWEVPDSGLDRCLIRHIVQGNLVLRHKSECLMALLSSIPPFTPFHFNEWTQTSSYKPMPRVALAYHDQAQWKEAIEITQYKHGK